MNLVSQIESIVFVASQPLKPRDMARALGVKEGEIKEVLAELESRYNHPGSGIHLLTDGESFRLGTNPENAEAINSFVKEEAVGELTKAQLETLTVVAYRGPVTRPELEQVRGVNCALIIRNLLIRGLINEVEAENKILPVYTLSFEALRHLGIRSVAELPDYDSLHAHEYLEQTLVKNQEADT